MPFALFEEDLFIIIFSLTIVPSPKGLCPF
nr:MAG TPA_asm: hypothetical protein [Bacteriophage sp.]